MSNSEKFEPTPLKITVKRIGPVRGFMYDHFRGIKQFFCHRTQVLYPFTRKEKK